MKKSIFLLSLLLSFLAFHAHATIVYVDSAHTGGTQNGASWATAFSNFQSGINAANAGDSVWVAKGTYTPDAANLYAFNMKEGVKILGGFLNNYTAFSQRNIQANATILKGNNNSVINNINNSLTNAALIDGFTITNGFSAQGGGIKNYNASPTINNCVFSNDTAYFDSYSKGGAIYNYNNNSKISNCIFLNNIVNVGNTSDVLGGGAIYNESATVMITDCSFSNNNTHLWGNLTCGGAIYNSAANVVITNCIFDSNESSFYGGAIANRNGSVLQVNGSNFLSNTTSSGGAIFNEASMLTINHSIFNGNTSSGDVTITGIAPGGGAIFNMAYLTVDSSSFSSNNANGHLGCAILNEQYLYSNIKHCEFIGNGAPDSYSSGGAICNSHSDSISVVENCIIASNRAFSGGGVTNISARLLASNSLFSKNIADTTGIAWGGAIYNVEQAHSTIVNCDIVGNSARDAMGGGIFNRSGSSSSIINSIVWGNTDGVANEDSSSNMSYYSLVQGMPANSLYHNLDGNINPNFVDTANNDYRLTNLSLCINTGSNDSISAGITTDIAGNDRIFDGMVDLGAYEYNIIAAPSVNLGSDSFICAGSIISLTAPYFAYASYQWNTGDTGRIIEANIAGTYYVTISNALGLSSDTINIIVNPLPIVTLGNDTSIIAGSSIALNAGNPGSAYLWNTGATSQTITIDTSGTYSVTVTNSNGCSGTDTIVISIAPLGINEVGAVANTFAIHPNPTHDLVNIGITDLKLLHTNAILIDAYGRVVRSITIEHKSQPLSLAGLAPGIYILKMENGAAAKIVKE